MFRSPSFPMSAAMAVCIRRNLRNVCHALFTALQGMKSALAPSPSSAGNTSSTEQYGSERDKHSKASATQISETWATHLQNLATMIIAGGIAGCTMWAIVLPIDGAKSRIQTAYRGSVRDIGLTQTLHQMWCSGGLQGLWAGLWPTMLRAFPANAAQWVVWEVSLAALQRSKSDA